MPSNPFSAVDNAAPNPLFSATADTDVNPFVPSAAAPSVFDKVTGALGGFLSKATDTALDVAGLYAVNKLTGAKQAVPGTVYPSGQNDPAALVQLQAAQKAQGAPAAVSMDMNKVLLYGGLALAGVLVLSLVTRK
jgi:hypothetical protein